MHMAGAPATPSLSGSFKLDGGLPTIPSHSPDGTHTPAASPRSEPSLASSLGPSPPARERTPSHGSPHRDESPHVPSLPSLPLLPFGRRRSASKDDLTKAPSGAPEPAKPTFTTKVSRV
jgi:hypothetical protein